jgi:hypothetical protein
MKDDFYMYYGDSWISILRDGIYYPFFVDSTRYQGSGDECDERLFSDHALALATTQFRGHIITGPQGNTESVRIMGDDPSLIFEPHDLGYIKIDGKWKWNTFTTYYSVKKGLTIPRMYQRYDSNRVYFNLFNIKPDGEELLHRDLVLYDNTLEYKGAIVGTKIENTITIISEYKIFIPWFSGLIPSCQLQLQTVTS